MGGRVDAYPSSFMDKSKETLLENRTYESEERSDRVKCLYFRWLSDWIVNRRKSMNDVFVELYEMGRADPRNFVFAVKMGFSLSLISLVIFFKDFATFSQYSIWAVLTVIVVFEYNVGKCLNFKF